MQTEAINTTLEGSQEQEITHSKPFKLSNDGNLGMQMAFMSGIGGILYYLFSCTCPLILNQEKIFPSTVKVLHTLISFLSSFLKD